MEKGILIVNHYHYLETNYPRSQKVLTYSTLTYLKVPLNPKREWHQEIWANNLLCGIALWIDQLLISLDESATRRLNRLLERYIIYVKKSIKGINTVAVAVAVISRAQCLRSQLT